MIQKRRLQSRSFVDITQSNVRGAHFLAQHPGLFDAAFFNITAAEAKASTYLLSQAEKC